MTFDNQVTFILIEISYFTILCTTPPPTKKNLLDNGIKWEKKSLNVNVQPLCVEICTEHIKVQDIKMI